MQGDLVSQLNTPMLKALLGDSLDSLDMLILTSEHNVAERMCRLLDEAYPLCPGSPDVQLFEEIVFSETVNYAVLGKYRWPVVCLLWPALSGIGKPMLTRLLARLRDLHADKVIHIESSSAETEYPDGWSMTDSLALGFSQRTSVNTGDVDLQIFEFDIRTYKSAPDWLNAKHWANPEMWEKHRW